MYFKNKKTVAIIQARISSTRFPNKIFSELGEKPALFNVINQCLASKVDKVILAIPANQRNHFSQVENTFSDNKNFKIWKGSEENVLKRFQESASDAEADIIVRITSDCFLINSNHINESLTFFKNSDFDYINNSTVDRVLSEEIPDDYMSDTDTPDGFNIEVFTSQSLEDAYENASSKYDIEHVTPWIKRNKNCSVFNTGKISLKGKFSVDTPEDLEIVRALYTLIKANRINFETQVD
tara:strand:- start:110 stop:826 length:717 start_codon:yes stop_codon:yes gene_type:complete